MFLHRKLFEHATLSRDLAPFLLQEPGRRGRSLAAVLGVACIRAFHGPIGRRQYNNQAGVLGKLLPTKPF